jgi:hypothetical protein
MSFEIESILPGAAAENDEVRALRRERVLTAAATTFAVLIVAAIAVLMGMS